MLTPRGRRALPPTRREHWRVVAAVVIVLVVCLVVGEVVDQVVKSSTAVGQRTDKTWVAAVATIVDESNTLSPALHAIRAHATDPAVFDRVTLEYALAQLARSAESDANTYREIGLAAPSQRADALMAGVLNLRRAGAESLARGIALAISRRGGRSSLPQAGQLLATAGSRFLAADAGYHALVVALDKDASARRLPSSVWIASPGVWSGAAARAWANDLRSAAILAFSPVLSIVAVTLEPPPLDITGLPATTTVTTTTLAKVTTLPTTAKTARKGHARRQATVTTSTTTPNPVAKVSTNPARAKPTTTTTTLPSATTTLQIPPAGSVSVVAATSRLEVVVVVENTGDATALGAYLTVVLSPVRSSHTGAARVSARHRLLSLVPGASQYVVMPKLAVKHATGYELVVTATIPSGPSATRSIALYVSN